MGKWVISIWVLEWIVFWGGLVYCWVYFGKGFQGIVYTHTHTHIYIYIYIYIERERERRVPVLPSLLTAKP